MMQNKTAELRPDSLLTSYQVGALLQYNPSSVNKWVKDGRLPAFRTPGGHRRIRASDLVAFLSKHQMPIPQSLVQAARRRLLLVSDQPAELERLRLQLAPYHDRLQLFTAQHGVDALVAVGGLAPQLVVFDLHAEASFGLQVCERLRAGEHTRHIEVVLSYPEITGERERQARAVGAKGCLLRPLEARALLQLIGIAG